MGISPILPLTCCKQLQHTLWWPNSKALVLKAGYVTHEAKFESIMQTTKDVEINALRSVDPDDPRVARYMPYTYLMSENLEKWTQSHDGERCFGWMTTNISECFNGVLKGARGLPIAAMVEFTWCKLVTYFHDRQKQLLLIPLKVRCGVIMQ